MKCSERRKAVPTPTYRQNDKTWGEKEASRGREFLEIDQFPDDSAIPLNGSSSLPPNTNCPICFLPPHAKEKLSPATTCCWVDKQLPGSIVEGGVTWKLLPGLINQPLCSAPKEGTEWVVTTPYLRQESLIFPSNLTVALLRNLPAWTSFQEYFYPVSNILFFAWPWCHFEFFHKS